MALGRMSVIYKYKCLRLNSFVLYLMQGYMNYILMRTDMAQMQTLSIRLPDEDFQWLLSARPETGKTPSEKLAVASWRAATMRKSFSPC